MSIFELTSTMFVTVFYLSELFFIYFFSLFGFERTFYFTPFYLMIYIVYLFLKKKFSDYL